MWIVRLAQQTNSLVVDVVSDLICPWCFVAKRRVEKAAAILGEKIEMHWLPFELNTDMPVDGLDRRVYRSAKFGCWEQSRRLDAQVAAAGAEVGITFHHDRMKRTPNTFRDHVLLAAALKQGLEMQGKVAERLFQAYFVNGEDVGDLAVLLSIAREFGVSAISRGRLRQPGVGGRGQGCRAQSLRQRPGSSADLTRRTSSRKRCTA
jgi:predicted DsbA family dithiol-disulfide isomerase